MNPTNVCSAGNLVQADSHNGFAIFAGPDLQPGEGRRGEITIANLGTMPATLRLFEAGASNEYAAGRLALEIKELCGNAGRRIFLGEIGTVPPAGIDLGRFEAGESRTYRFILLLRKGTPVEELGRSAGATYEWRVDSIRD